MPPSDEKELVIKKSNDLVEARYKLTIGEQRLILLLASQIRKDDEDFKDYEVRVEDFARWFNLEASSSIYEKVEKIADNLVGKVVTLKNESEIEKTTWISYIRYIRGSGVVKLRFDKSLKPYLLQLNANFTQYNLSCVVNFKSSYSVRLYELLKMEVWKAEKAKKIQFEKKFEINEYKSLLGIEKKNYPIFADLKKRVIDPTVREISEQTDLEILETKYIKTGRKITGICFVVLIRSEEETNARTEKLRLEDICVKTPKEEDHPIFLALENYGISFEVAKKLKNKYGIERIKRNLTYIDAQIQANKVINDKPAFLRSAIEGDYGNALDVEEKKKKERLAQRQAEEEKKRYEELEVERKKKEEIAKRRRILEAFFALPEKMQGYIKSDFESYLKENKTYEGIIQRWNLLKSQKEILIVDDVGYRFCRFIVDNNLL